MLRWMAAVLLSLSITLTGCEALTALGTEVVSQQIKEDKPLLDVQVGGKRDKSIKAQDNKFSEEIGDVDAESLVVNVDNGTPSWLIALMIALLAIPDAGTLLDNLMRSIFKRREEEDVQDK